MALTLVEAMFGGAALAFVLFWHGRLLPLTAGNFPSLRAVLSAHPLSAAYVTGLISAGIFLSHVIPASFHPFPFPLLHIPLSRLILATALSSVGATLASPHLCPFTRPLRPAMPMLALAAALLSATLFASSRFYPQPSITATNATTATTTATETTTNATHGNLTPITQNIPLLVITLILAAALPAFLPNAPRVLVEVIAYVLGALTGLGLVAADALHPRKVTAALDIEADAWDPSFLVTIAATFTVLSALPPTNQKIPLPCSPVQGPDDDEHLQVHLHHLAHHHHHYQPRHEHSSSPPRLHQQHTQQPQNRHHHQQQHQQHFNNNLILASSSSTSHPTQATVSSSSTVSNLTSPGLVSIPMTLQPSRRQFDSERVTTFEHWNEDDNDHNDWDVDIKDPGKSLFVDDPDMDTDDDETIIVDDDDNTASSTTGTATIIMTNIDGAIDYDNENEDEDEDVENMADITLNSGLKLPDAAQILQPPCDWCRRGAVGAILFGAGCGLSGIGPHSGLIYFGAFPTSLPTVAVIVTMFATTIICSVVVSALESDRYRWVIRR